MQSRKIPECHAVAPTPFCGDPADTMAQPFYSGAPEPRGDMSVDTGGGSDWIPYQDGSGVVNSSGVLGLGGYGL